MRIVVLIATYNESENIESLVKRILNLDQSFDVLVVDDNSPDGTFEIAERMSGETGRVRVLRRAAKMGLGTALKEGMVLALEHGYDFVCTMDADHSHAPEYLTGMVEAAYGADIVVGSRYIRGGGVRNWPLARRILSRAANLYARTLMGLKVGDCTSGYRVYSKKFLESAPFDRTASTGFSFLVEMLYDAKNEGFKIIEYPIVFVERIKGISKITFSEVLKGAWSLLRRRLAGGKNM